MVEVDYTTMSEAELQSAMTKAVAGSDWTAVKKIASAMSKIEAEKEKAAKAELQSKLAELTDKVKAIIDKAIQKMISAGELDGADGVWYGWDFGDQSSGCKLVKAKARAGGGGGNGGGKRYDVSTADLLKDYGDVVDEKSGMTLQAMFDDAEQAEDKKNAVYKVRVKLLKASGKVS